MEDEDFSLELIYDLHKIVGIDAVTEYYENIESEEDKQRFLVALKEYYDTKYWEKIENGCSI